MDVHEISELLVVLDYHVSSSLKVVEEGAGLLLLISCGTQLTLETVLVVLTVVVLEKVGAVLRSGKRTLDDACLSQRKVVYGL